MSKYNNYQFPFFNMGFAPKEGAPHAMPVVRVVGPWAGTPEAEELLQAKSTQIVHDTTKLRQHYYTGILPMARKFVVNPDYRMEYLMYGGQEIVTITPFPGKKPEETQPLPEPETKDAYPDALVLEFIWDDPSDPEPIPYWRLTGIHGWMGVQLGGPNAPFPFAFWCGPTFATVDGIPFGEGGTDPDVGPVAQARFPGYPPSILDEVGRAPAELYWESSKTAPGYRNEVSLGDIPISGYAGSWLEISATGPNACSATRTGVFVPAPLGPSQEIATPWDSPTYVDSNWTTYERAYRWQGYKDIDPHLLISRVEVASGKKKGAYVGANGGQSSNFPNSSSNWDDTDLYGLPLTGEPFWSGRLYLYEYYDYPATKRSAELWGPTDNRRRLSHLVVLDVNWYRKNVDPNQAVLDLHGFWRNPRHSKTRFFGRPNGNGPKPPQDFPTWGPAYNYVESSRSPTFDTTWYDEPTPPISAANVTIVATWLWGLPKDDPYALIEEAAFNTSEYRQKSTVFARSISACQQGHNGAQAPNEGQWGTKMGRLTANYDKVEIQLSRPSTTP